MVRIIGLTALLLAGTAARAEVFPHFDTDAMCRAAPDIGGGSNRQIDRSCLTDETQARDELQKKWTSYNVRRRDMCVQQTMIGGSPSYVDVLTCIEFAADSAPATQPPRARRNPRGGT